MQGRATTLPVDGSTTRLLVATAFSIACHLGVVLLASVATWRGIQEPPRAITVALLGGGGGEHAAAAAGAGAGVGVGEARPAAALAPVSLSVPSTRVAPPRAPRPVPERMHAREQPTVVAAKSASHERLAAVDDHAVTGPSGIAPVAVPGDAAAGGDGRGAGGGPGTGGGRGGGNGGGVGEGSGTGDGLRVWCRTCPAPDYPVRARRQGWEGTVHVDLDVDRDGAVAAARVGRSSGFAPLDAAAVAAARRSRFKLPDGGDGLHGRLRYRFVLEDPGRASAAAAPDESRVR